MIDQPVSADDITLFIINGLGPEYGNIVGLIWTRETPLRFEELHDLLFEHELALKAQESASRQLVVTANPAHVQQRGPSQKSRNGQQHSNRGGSNQGRSNASPNSGRGNSNRGGSQTRGGGSNSSRPQVTCQLCGYHGHSALTCRRPPMTVNVAASPSSGHSPSPWLVDSGASHNLTNDLSNLSIHSEYDGTDEVHIADGSGMPISHTGTSVLRFPARTFTLSDVLCVPSARRNLISISKFTASNGVSMEFFPSYFLVKDRLTGAPLVKGSCCDGVYQFPSASSGLVFGNKVAAFGVRASSADWHARLGHPSSVTTLYLC